jgi:hypothetical protein
MYGEGTGSDTLVTTGVAMKVVGFFFGLPGIVLGVFVLVVGGMLLMRLAGRKRRYVP